MAPARHHLDGAASPGSPDICCAPATSSTAPTPSRSISTRWPAPRMCRRATSAAASAARSARRRTSTSSPAGSSARVTCCAPPTSRSGRSASPSGSPASARSPARSAAASASPRRPTGASTPGRPTGPDPAVHGDGVGPPAGGGRVSRRQGSGGELASRASRHQKEGRKMIDAMSHVGVWVADQDEAKAFYTEKLGFEVREDATLEELGGYRWLTVGPPGQPDFADPQPARSAGSTRGRRAGARARRQGRDGRRDLPNAGLPRDVPGARGARRRARRSSPSSASTGSTRRSATRRATSGASSRSSSTTSTR